MCSLICLSRVIRVSNFNMCTNTKSLEEKFFTNVMQNDFVMVRKIFEIQHILGQTFQVLITSRN